MIAGEYVNFIVALSNIFGVIYFPTRYTGIATLMITASTLMHLSEVKHGLPGMTPFNQYSYIFLWWDRIMAYICTVIVSYEIYARYKMLPTHLIPYGIFGLFCNFISEVIITDQHYLFVIFHSIWHHVAYHTFYLVLNVKNELYLIYLNINNCSTMSTLTVILPLYRNSEWIFTTDKLIKFAPNSLLATTVDLTHENDIVINQPFVTPDVMNVLWNIIEHSSIPRFDPDIGPNLIRVGNYLNIDLLVMIGDLQWQHFITEHPNVNLLNPDDLKMYGNDLLVWSVKNDYLLLMDYMLGVPDINLDQIISVLLPEGNEWIEFTDVRKYSVWPVSQKLRVLSYTSYHGYLDLVVRVLRDPRIDLKKEGYAAVRLATSKHHTNIVQKLLPYLSNDDKEGALETVSSLGYIDIIDLLLGDPNFKPSFYYPLFVAIQSGQTRVVERLLQDPSVDPSTSNNGLLEETIATSRYDIAVLLLQDHRVITAGLDNAYDRAVEENEADLADLINSYM